MEAPLTYPIHPAAKIFPTYSATDLRELADSIKSEGLQQPIVLLDGAVLDGINRLAACELAEVQPRFIDALPSVDPIAYVIAANLRRRHLDESQRAIVAARISAYRKDLEGKSANLPKIRQAEAAEQMSVSVRSVGDATKVLKSARAELVAAVEAGTIPVSTAADLAKAPASVQKRAAAGGKKIARELAEKQPKAPRKKPSAEEAEAIESERAHAEDSAPRDALGRRLPDEIAPDYQNAAEAFAQASNLATQLVKVLGQFPWLGRLRESVRLLGAEIRNEAPATKCVHCKLIPALREVCSHCNGRGWSSAAQFKTAIEPLKIDGAQAVVFYGENGSRELVRVADLV